MNCERSGNHNYELARVELDMNERHVVSLVLFCKRCANIARQYVPFPERAKPDAYRSPLTQE